MISKKEIIAVGALIFGALAVIELPFVAGKLATPAGNLFLGTVHYPTDYLSYLSQFIQGREHWLFSTWLYTGEKIPLALVGWPHVLSGRILLSLGFDVITAYQIAVVFFLLLFFICAYFLISLLLPKNPAKRILTFVFFLTSTALFKFIKTPAGWDVSYHSYWYNLGLPHARFGPVPYHLLGSTLLTVLLSLFVIYFGKKGFRFIHLVAITLASFMLASINPVHWGLTLAAVSITGLFSFLVVRNETHRHYSFYLLPAIASIVGGLPMALYIRYVYTLPRFNLVPGWEAGQYLPVNLLTLVYGSGIIVIFALIGLFSLKRWGIGRLPVIVFLIIASVLHLSRIPTLLKLTNARFWPAPIYIILAFLATEGIYLFANKAKKYKKSFLLLAFGVYIVSLVPTYVAFYREFTTSKLGNAYYYIPVEAVEAYREAQKLSKPGEIFLVQWPFNDSFPALTGRKSVFSSAIFTIDFDTKMLEGFALIDGKLNTEKAREYLTKYNVDYIMLYPWNPFVKTLPYLKRIYTNSLLAIDKVVL